MNLQTLLYRFRWLHAPAGILMLLLQRTPVLRVLVSESPGFGLQSGEVLKSAFALVALGAYNSVAGATVFNATPVSPTTVTPASGAANTTFTASGTQNTAFSVSFTATGAPGVTRSWKVLGTFPAGLSVTGGTAITGGYLFNGITKVIIAGTPTAAGSQTLTVTGYDTTGGTGNNAHVTCVIDIAGPPVFTTQPLSQTITAGGNVTFTAAATGTPAPTFQWFLGPTALPGKTAATLTLTNVQAVNAGDYTVKATNSAAPSGVSSNIATLTVNPATVAPTFSTQPVSQTVTAGGNVTFTAAATGTPTPTLQWFLGTTALPGQTSATLTLTNVQPSNSGNYTVKATNAAAPSGVSSTVAVLSVNVVPTFGTQPVSQTVTAGGNVTFTAAATGTPTPTLQWFLGTTALPGQTSATLTLTNVQPSDAGNYTVKATNAAAPSGVSSTVAVLSVNVVPTFSTQPVSQTVTAGGNVTFTAAATGTPTPTLQWFLGTTALPGQTASTLTLTNVQPSNSGNYTVKATNAAAPSGVSSTVAVLSVNVVPNFSTQPVSQTVTAGGNVTFTAAATGTPTPTLQWFLGTTALPGQTASTLTLTNVQPSDAGNYIVKATNAAAPSGVSSTVAVLSVNVVPTFGTQPVSQTVTAGGNVTFTAAATGTPTPTLQWFLGTTALPGQTAATLTLTNVQPSDAGNYTVKATNAAAPSGVSSTVAVLSVNVVPTFGTQPVSQTVTAGGNVTFTAAATGTPTPTLQWFLGTTALPGQTSATLTLTNVQPSDAGNYTVKATNAAAPSGVSSNIAVLSVPTALESWRMVEFGVSANSGTAADTADPDRDGLPNLMEYALGGTPTLASSAPAPVVGTVLQGIDPHLTLTFTPRRPELAYSIETSSDLTGAWTSVPLSNLTMNQAFTFTDATGLSAASRRYLRLRVTP